MEASGECGWPDGDCCVGSGSRIGRVGGDSGPLALKLSAPEVAWLSAGCVARMRFALLRPSTTLLCARSDMPCFPPGRCQPLQKKSDNSCLSSALDKWGCWELRYCDKRLSLSFLSEAEIGLLQQRFWDLIHAEQRDVLSFKHRNCGPFGGMVWRQEVTESVGNSHECSGTKVGHSGPYLYPNFAVPRPSRTRGKQGNTAPTRGRYRMM